MTKTNNIYIIGCGNILAGDDGIGIVVVRKLLEEGNLPPGVEVIEAGVPGLSLVEMMLGADKVVLVDSFLAGLELGEVKRFDEAELPPVGFSAGQSHGIGLREALSFARGVMPGSFPSRVVIVGVGIQRPRRWVEGLSPPVEAAVEQAVALVKAEVFLSA